MDSNQTEKRAYTTAIASAIKAGNHVLKYWPNPSNPHFNHKLVMQIFDKNEGIGNYATIADKESEDIIVSAIQSDPILKTHKILAEESHEVTHKSEWQWIIDPIDGTPPFKNGLPEFGISIGLLCNQEPIIGIIAAPAQSQLIAAWKGHGVTLQDFKGNILADLTKQKTQVNDLDKTLIAYDLGYENRGEQLQKYTAKIADEIGYAVCYGSSSIANFRVAQGLIGAYFINTPTKFDIGAASAILAELGGIVTDMQGKSIDWNAKSRSYLGAKDPQVHRKILNLLNS